MFVFDEYLNVFDSMLVDWMVKFGILLKEV